jgi:uncharacterized DUF497 family protein
MAAFEMADSVEAHSPGMPLETGVAVLPSRGPGPSERLPRLRHWRTIVPCAPEWSGTLRRTVPTRRSTAPRSTRRHSFSRGKADYLERFDEALSGDEDRFVAIGPSASGLIVVVFTERYCDTARIISARRATNREIDLFRAHAGRWP